MIGFDPAWQVAFERNDAVWVSRADGSAAHCIARRALAPAWSRDGRKVAFLRKDGIWICLPNGQKAHRIWKGVASSVSWHPSGRRLAISASTRQGEAILDLNLWTGLASTFAGLEASDNGAGFTFGGNSAAEWSPDGQSLAFARNGDVWLATASYARGGGRSGWDVFRLRAVALYDAPTYRASRENVAAYRFAWSSDSRRLAYAVKRKGGSGTAEIAVLSLKGGEVERTEAILPDEIVFNPSFAPDGRTLTVERFDSERQVMDVIFPGTRHILHNATRPAWKRPTLRTPPFRSGEREGQGRESPAN